MVTNSESFFDQRTPSSIAKSRIVWKYFDAYLGALGSKLPVRFTFADLFSGPGYYGSSLSTPLELLDLLERKASFRNRVKLIFNDQNSHYIAALKTAVEARLKTNPMALEPEFSSVEVGS